MQSKTNGPQDLFKDADREKIFEGSYLYFKDGKRYSEETFQVFTNDLSSFYWYEAETMTRIENGEFLKTKTAIQTDGRWTPLIVHTQKSIGAKRAQELYVYNDQGPEVHYKFIADEGTFEHQIKVPSKFHIATPSFLCSMLFVQTIIFNVRNAEEMTVITSANDWEGLNAPIVQSILVEQKKSGTKEIVIKDNKLSCTEYLVYMPSTENGFQSIPLRFFISKHVAIPYKAELGDGVSISIDKLKKLKD